MSEKKNPEDMTDEEALAALSGAAAKADAESSESEEKKGDEESSSVSEEEGEGNDEGDEDSEGGESAGPEGETPEQRAERRRNERRERNERRRRARAERERREREKDEEIRRLRETVEGLQKNIGAINTSNVQTRIRDLDTAFENERNTFQQAERDIAEAVRLNDGAKMTKAMAARDASLERARRINAEKERIVLAIQRARSGQTNQGSQGNPTGQPNQRNRSSDDSEPLDPRAASHAQTWIKENPWFNKPGSETDTRVIATLDQQLADENYDPTTKEYWNELRSRAKTYLPHRYKTKSGGPPTAGSGSDTSSRSSNSNEGLSAERVALLKEIGAWDDPKERAKYIAEYKQYDANSGRR